MFSGDFSVVLPGFVSALTNTVVEAVDLDSCSVVSTGLDPASCRSQEFYQDISGYDIVSFGVMTIANPGTGIFYYFDDGAFGVAGVYDSVLLGASQAGRLTVTDLGGAGGAVPEPATWAMMIIGFGAAGSMIRRRRAVAV